jgi:putative membrane protein
VLGTGEPVEVEPIAHGPAARRRRYTRAMGGALAAVAAAVAVRVLLGWPDWIWQAALVAVPACVALAADRARSLGHALAAGHLVTRSGSIVRRRSALAREGVIGITLQRSWFQRRAGLMTLTATTAAGDQAYAVLDVGADEGLRVARATVPGLLEPFLDESPARERPASVPGRLAGSRD